MFNELTLGVIFAFSAAICWGSASILYKLVLKTESPIVSIIVRGIFAVPFIALLTLLINQFKSVMVLFSAEIFPILFLSSVFVGTGDLIYFFALQRLDVSKALPVASIYPLFTTILLFISGMEKLGLFVVFGTTSIVLGIGLISQKTNSNPEEPLKSKSSKIGLILAIGAAIFWSFGILTLRIIFENPQVDSFSLATIRFGIMTCLMFLIWLGLYYYEKKNIEFNPKIHTLAIPHLTKQSVLVIGISGILSWGIGGVVFFQAIQLIGASRATPISSISPLIGSLFGITFLKERTSLIQLIGIFF